jgi:ribosomal protein S27E
MTPTSVACSRCGETMVVAEKVSTPGDGPQIEMHQCGNCNLRAALIYEPEGGLSEVQRSWVEQQIAQRGSFFPSDFTQTRGPRY